MDHRRFDTFARTLASGTSRRALMRGMVGAAGLVGVGASRRTGVAHRSAQEGSGQATIPACDVTVCPAGRVFSMDSCACVCDVVCPPNFAADPTTCQCYCALGDFHVCPREDHVYDDNNCRCVCANDECPGDAILDSESCLCFCPTDIACPPGEEMDPTTCECVCNRQCVSPEILDDCLCVCGIEECDDPFILDAEACACVCPPEIACTLGKVVDPATCRCICPPDLACDNFRVLDPATCECRCRPGSPCPAPLVVDDETCECACPPEITCRADQTFDPETCECVCPSGTTICRDICVPFCLPTEAYDEDCQCTPIVCPPDRVLTCICACPPGMAECKEECLPACGLNQVFDDACRCVCRPNITCAAGWKLDPATCECVCAVTTCEAGKVLDAERCRCVCPANMSCPTERKLDPETCKCICDVAACPAGKILDKFCRCVCPPNIACPAGESVDPTTCACACQPGGVIERIAVPCNRATVTSSTTLAAGVTYTLRASGTCRLGVDIDGDAEHAFRPSDPTNVARTIDFCGATNLGIGIDDPTIDSAKPPQWGAYAPSHVYTTSFLGKGAPIDLNYHDCYYPDNAGSLTVEIFCPDPTGEPNPGNSGA